MALKDLPKLFTQLLVSSLPNGSASFAFCSHGIAAAHSSKLLLQVIRKSTMILFQTLTIVVRTWQVGRRDGLASENCTMPLSRFLYKRVITTPCVDKT